MLLKSGIGLVVLGLVFGWIRFGLGKTETPTTKYFENIGKSEITIAQQKLYFNQGRWMVLRNGTSQPADEEKVNELLKTLEGLTLNNLVSENKDNFSRLGIGQSAVEITAGNKKIGVGNLTSEGVGTYVLMGKNVYEQEVILNRELWQDDYWAKAWVTNLPRYQIKSVEVLMGEDKVTKLTADKEGKFANEALVDSASNLKSGGYLGQDESLEKLAKTRGKVTIETEGEKREIEIGKTTVKRKDVFWAKDKDGLDYFSISKENFLVLTDI
ncbi:MAG: DUF4340 domain-containing protein [Candidatus Shapirobacteria bacterium]